MIQGTRLSNICISAMLLSVELITMPTSFRDLKVVLIGAADVGKTCLILRYIDDSFNKDTENVSFGVVS